LLSRLLLSCCYHRPLPQPPPPLTLLLLFLEGHVLLPLLLLWLLPVGIQQLRQLLQQHQLCWCCCLPIWHLYAHLEEMVAILNPIQAWLSYPSISCTQHLAMLGTCR
jgi:hypothetical protein